MMEAEFNLDIQFGGYGKGENFHNHIVKEGINFENFLAEFYSYP
jgi:hypothetical protein